MCKVSRTQTVNIEWRIQETERINAAENSNENRLKDLAELLDQEASLLQKIDRLKGVAAEGNHDLVIASKLDAVRLTSSFTFVVI